MGPAGMPPGPMRFLALLKQQWQRRGGSPWLGPNSHFPKASELSGSFAGTISKAATGK